MTPLFSKKEPEESGPSPEGGGAESSEEGIAPNVEGREAQLDAAEGGGIPGDQSHLKTHGEVLDKIEELVGNVPVITAEEEKLRNWLRQWRAPLAHMMFVDVRGHVQMLAEGKSKEHLEALYRRLSPEELTQVMQANASTLKKLATETAREVALVRSLYTTATASMASHLLNAMDKAAAALAGEG